MRKNQILKIYGTDYKTMTKALLIRAALALRIPGKDTRIGIKPNLVSPTPASFGATTHPEIAAGIIEYLQENGFSKLTILEGAWVGDKTTEAFALCGYQNLSSQYNVPLFDTQSDTSFEKNCAGMPLQICSRLKDIDFLINVPVLKGHCQTKVTCALKNLKGLIPNAEKRRFHAMGLHKPIAHLNAGIHQDFIVIDHICGDLDCEDGGNPVVTNCIMAAADPVLADAYACHLLHYSSMEVPYIAMAEALGLGSADLRNAELLVCGKDGCFSRQDILSDSESLLALLPQLRRFVDLHEMIEEVESCSACYAGLVPALSRLRDDGLLDCLTTPVCIGQGFRGKSGTLGCGDCTAAFDSHIPGCPPDEEEIYQFLRHLLSQKL